ncbi:MAG: GNAT family N-acetyltransferase [Rhizobiaceae bacterium]|nr:GNAT family N-acetyltransferase [Rhizobiaceae bacterium]MCV0408112.1 GNAT family N-acetyltransferase [Rhizobiaceae bacterium]
MRLETARFLLREFRHDDLEAFRAYQTDERYVALRSANEDIGPPPEDLLALFIGWQDDEPRLCWQLAVEDRASGSLIGTAGLRRSAAKAREAEFGIELAPAQWGRHRAAIEIAQAVMEFGFRALEVDTIIGRSTAGNSAVARLARHAGAELLTESAVGGAAGSAVAWRVTRRAWEAR